MVRLCARPIEIDRRHFIYHSQYRVVWGLRCHPIGILASGLHLGPDGILVDEINFTIARMGIPLAANIHYPC